MELDTPATADLAERSRCHIQSRVTESEDIRMADLVNSVEGAIVSQIDLGQCCAVLDESSVVDARQLGERDTEWNVETRIRHWTAVALVEQGLAHFRDTEPTIVEQVTFQ